tara:strand:- start:75 stop:356 length:282 start_codon:yes stop_codon:yes gene_type:complete
MDCPKCGKKWSVKNTAPSSDTTRVHLRRKVDSFLNWYSEDYVVRLRHCTHCKYDSITVELEGDDIVSMMKICSSEGYPVKKYTFSAKKKNKKG